MTTTNGERREAFEREGFVVVRELLDEATVRALLAASDEVVLVAARLEEDATIRGARFHVQSASGRTGERAREPGLLRKVTFPAAISPAFARLLRDRRVAGALRDVGLPAARCVVDQLNLKAPRVGTGFPWHQDARFLPWQQRDEVARHGGANVVIGLDPADASNGGFEVLARTHRGGPRDFDYDTSTTNAGVFDETLRTPVPLAPGDAVLFHPYLAHGSGPNTSDRPRRMATLWFVGLEPPAGPPFGN